MQRRKNNKELNKLPKSLRMTLITHESVENGLKQARHFIVLHSLYTNTHLYSYAKEILDFICKGEAVKNNCEE